MKKLLLIGTMSVLLVGCAVQKELVPTGGSKADGIVELSYSYRRFESPQIDFEQGARAAKKRCEKWGYKDAERFGGQKRVCSERDGAYSCAEHFVTIEYQCIDK